MQTLRIIVFNCIIFIAVALLASCGGSSTTSGAGVAESGTAGYPLPAVPDSITDPVKRAEFAVMHYWDSYDFRGRGQLSDTVYIEQSLVDFWALLSMAEPATAQNAVNGFLDKVAVYPKQLALIDWLAGKYLDDPNSPMRNEDIYIMFLEWEANSESIAEEIRLRANFRLERAMMNRPGMRGSDFAFIDREGRRFTLMEAVKSDTTLVMYYDPDCEQCKSISESLSRTRLPEHIKVIAIDVAGDKDLWDSTRNMLPSAWTVGFAESDIEEEELYSFPALPSFYIYSPEGIVLAKDVPPQSIIR